MPMLSSIGIREKVAQGLYHIPRKFSRKIITAHGYFHSNDGINILYITGLETKFSQEFNLRYALTSCWYRLTRVYGKLVILKISMHYDAYINYKDSNV